MRNLKLTYYAKSLEEKPLEAGVIVLRKQPCLVL